ncbi:unnamed protein product [Gadus morhua 'NCC']
MHASGYSRYAHIGLPQLEPRGAECLTETPPPPEHLGARGPVRAVTEWMAWSFAMVERSGSEPCDAG